ncbi:hydrogenase maturation protease [Streptomyces sp. NPDC057877]|uniref:hydrogenase maturation protease n=1 Tax=Streptomyces sp. NPDC057877 TaxID=3346269 RepID=UPI00368A0650
MRTHGRVTVTGVGNEFRRDDGVAWAVLARLRERSRQRPLPPGTEPATCDGDPGRLSALWEGTHLAVVVDPAHAHPGTPGRGHRLGLGAGALARSAAPSSHGPGLGAAVELARVPDPLPERRVGCAVEGAGSALGTGLSPAVADAVAPLAEAAEAEIAPDRDTSGGRPT